MRHSPFTAVYDACVLYPAPLRDLMMWLGLSGLYRARWSAQIHEEWTRNLLKNRPDLTMDQLSRTVALMDKAIPGALVTGHEVLCSELTLPDPDDRHVLAAAIRCKAEVIVTFNLKDFPPETLDAFDIEPQHPDEFIIDLWDLDQAAVLASVQRHRATLKSPAMSAEQYLDMMLRQGIPQTVNALNSFQYVL
jgi:predicted nucleic acid-binding protein